MEHVIAGGRWGSDEINIHDINVPFLLLSFFSMPESYLDPAPATEKVLLNGRVQEKAVILCPYKGKLLIVSKNTGCVAWILEMAVSTTVLLKKSFTNQRIKLLIKQGDSDKTVVNSLPATST